MDRLLKEDSEAIKYLVVNQSIDVFFWHSVIFLLYLDSKCLAILLKGKYSYSSSSTYATPTF